MLSEEYYKHAYPQGAEEALRIAMQTHEESGAKAAETFFKAAYRMNPAGYKELRSISLNSWDIKQYEDCARYLEEFLTFYPGEINWAYFQLLKSYLMSGDIEGAKSALERYATDYKLANEDPESEYGTNILKEEAKKEGSKDSEDIYLKLALFYLCSDDLDSAKLFFEEILDNIGDYGEKDTLLVLFAFSECLSRLGFDQRAEVFKDKLTRRIQIVREFDN